MLRADVNKAAAILTAAALLAGCEERPRPQAPGNLPPSPAQVEGETSASPDQAQSTRQLPVIDVPMSNVSLRWSELTGIGWTVIAAAGTNLSACEASGPQEGVQVEFGPQVMLEGWSIRAQMIKMHNDQWYVLASDGDNRVALTPAVGRFSTEFKVTASDGVQLDNQQLWARTVNLHDGHSYLIVAGGTTGLSIRPMKFSLAEVPPTPQARSSNPVTIPGWNSNVRMSEVAEGRWMMIAAGGTGTAACEALAPQLGVQIEFGQNVTLPGSSVQVVMAKMPDSRWYVVVGSSSGIGVTEASGSYSSSSVVEANPFVQVPDWQVYETTVRMQDGHNYLVVVGGSSGASIRPFDR